MDKDAMLHICSTQCPHISICDGHVTGGTYRHDEQPCLLRPESLGQTCPGCGHNAARDLQDQATLICIGYCHPKCVFSRTCEQKPQQVIECSDTQNYQKEHPYVP